MSTTKTYAGWIFEGPDDNNPDNPTAIALAPEQLEYMQRQAGYRPHIQQTLVEEIAKDREEYGPFITCRYVISQWKTTIDDAETRLLEYMDGDRIGTEDQWSEITGYLWTDDYLVFGGHNIAKELERNVGRYCVIECRFQKEKEQ